MKNRSYMKRTLEWKYFLGAMLFMLLLAAPDRVKAQQFADVTVSWVGIGYNEQCCTDQGLECTFNIGAPTAYGDPDPRFRLRSKLANDVVFSGWSVQTPDNVSCPYGGSINVAQFTRNDYCGGNLEIETQSWEEDGITCGTNTTFDVGCFAGVEDDDNNDFTNFNYNYQALVPEGVATNVDFFATGTPGTRRFTLQINWSSAGPSAPLLAPVANACLNSSTTLTVTSALSDPGYEFRWYSDIGLTTQVGIGTSFNTPILVGNVSYWVAEVDPVGGCKGQSNRIDLTPLAGIADPTASDVTICEGQTAFLEAFGEDGATFTWYDDAGLTHAVQVGAQYTTQPLNTTTSFWVTQQLPGGCPSAAIEVEVTVNPPADLPFGTSGYTFCLGSTVPAGDGLQATCSDAGGGGNLTDDFAGTGGPVVIPSNPGTGSGSLSFNAGAIPAGSTVVKVTVDATLGHTWSGDLTLTVNSPGGGIVNVHDGNGGNDNFGTGDPLAPTPATYTWDDAGPLPTYANDPNANANIPVGSYIPVEPLSLFNGEDPTGVWSLDLVDAVGGDGGSLTSANLHITYSLAANAGSLTWWDDETAGTQVGSGSPFLPAGYDGFAPGTYTYWAQCDDASTCSNRRVPVTLTILPAIAAPIIRGDDEVCEGESATLTVANPIGTVEWYADIALTGLVHTGPVFTTPELSSTTTYYAVNNNGTCLSAASAWTISVNPAPTLAFGDVITDPGYSFSGNIEICEDQVVSLQIILDDPANQLALIYTESEPEDLNADWLLITDEFAEINTMSDMIYYVRVVDLNTGCFSKPVPVYIDVFDRPNPPQVRGTTVCVGEEATIYADISTIFDNSGDNAQNTVYWADEDGFFIETHPIPFVPGPPYIFNDSLNVGSFGTPGVYNYYVTTGNNYCYSVPQVVTVTVLARPEAPLARDIEVCEGDDAMLTATCSGDIYWYSDDDLQNMVHVGDEFPLFGVTSTTTYYVTCRNGDCESDASEVTVTVNPKPEAPTPDLPFYVTCFDESIELFASNSNGDPILWYDDPAGLIEWSTDSSGSFFTPEITEPNIYYAAAVDPITGCRSDLVPVQVFTTPKFEHPRVEDVQVCASGDSVTLKAHISFPRDLAIDFFDFFTFSNAIVRFVNTSNGLLVFGDVPVELDPFNDIWEGDASLTIPAVSADWDFTVPGSYDIGARTANFWFNVWTGDLFECSSDYGTGTVVVLPRPEPPVVSNTSPVCERGNVTVSSEPVPGGIYNWTGPNGFSSNAQEFTLFNVTTLQAGTYTLVVTDVNGCQSDDATTEVVVNPAPVIDTAYADPNPICEHETLNLFAEADDDDDDDYDYNWTGPNGYESTEQNPSIADVTEVDNQGFYIVVATDETTGCTSLPYVVLVEINTFPDNLIADNDGPVCEGGTIRLNVTSVFGADYEWSGPNGYSSTEQSPVLTDVTPDMTGTYTVVVTLAGGCTDSATTEVIVWPNPVADAGPDDTTYQDDPIVLTGSGGTTYQWVPNTYLDHDNIPNPIFNSPDVGTFPIVLTVWEDDHGCSDKDTVIIEVLPKLDLQIPDLITPNGDGLNDNWIIKYLENIRDPYTLNVYARGGAKVYSTTAYNNDWNGTYDGKNLPDGGYWFVLAIEGGKTYKGSITIKR
jgi:gliding motility-associated-like protein